MISKAIFVDNRSSIFANKYENPATAGKANLKYNDKKLASLLHSTKQMVKIQTRILFRKISFCQPNYNCKE